MFAQFVSCTLHFCLLVRSVCLYGEVVFAQDFCLFRVSHCPLMLTVSSRTRPHTQAPGVTLMSVTFPNKPHTIPQRILDSVTSKTDRVKDLA